VNNQVLVLATVIMINQPYCQVSLSSVVAVTHVKFTSARWIFDTCHESLLGQIIFVIYMILVTLLLVNMLIAMMGHTYETVNESQKEWYRQVRAAV